MVIHSKVLIGQNKKTSVLDIQRQSSLLFPLFLSLCIALFTAGQQLSLTDLEEGLRGLQSPQPRIFLLVHID